MLVSVDPGVNGLGVACWADGKLLCAAYVPVTFKSYSEAHGAGMAVFDYIQKQRTATALAIELPQVYEPRKSKGKPEDLIRLSAVVGAIEARVGAKVTRYLPKEWKGQVPKEVMCKRIMGKLSEEEMRKVTLANASLMHNVWDSIGIGLRYLNRL